MDVVRVTIASVEKQIDYFNGLQQLITTAQLVVSLIGLV